MMKKQPVKDVMINDKRHSKRCENSQTKVCKCECGGVFHALYKEMSAN